MSKARAALVIAIVSAISFVGAGCGDDDDTGAGTTAPPATTAATTTAATTTEGTTTEGTTTEATGDAAAGQTFFETTCQGCHLQGGTQAGAGPVLADRGLTADGIRQQIVNPRGQMPPNLASGTDLDNVVAFVVSLQ